MLAHLFVVASALVPGPQKVHELRPSLLLTKPEVATQGVQVEAAAPDTSPMGQVVHAPALGPLKVPGSQIVHASAPSGANVPPSHSWQVDAPSPAYVPAAQFNAHSDEPAELNLPAAQFSQASSAGVLFLPLSHSAHTTAPVAE
jgi:hypothetical protein